MFPDLTRDDVFRIETKRLWLRWPRARDVPAIVRLAGERAVADMTARIPHPIDPHGIDAFVVAARGSNAEGGGLVMGVSLRAQPDRLVGMVGIETDEHTGLPHLGYWLGQPHWGRGLAREAAAAMVEAAFAYAGLPELTSSVMVGNDRSRRVLESCGFRALGTETRFYPVRGADRTIERFGLARAAWCDRPRG